MNLSTRFAAVTALLLLSGTALAQTAPLQGVPPAPVFTVPAPVCDRPPTTAGARPTPDDSKKWNKKIEDYKKCMVAYQQSLGESAKAYSKVANQLIDTANSTMADFNAYAQQVRKDNDMDDDDDSGGAPPSGTRAPGH
jgi:hypothetical protein